MFPNLKFMLIAAAACVLFSGGMYVKGRWDGSAACDARHAEAQIEQDKKARKTDAKIKRSAPSDADKPGGIKFLLQHVRQ